MQCVYSRAPVPSTEKQPPVSALSIFALSIYPIPLAPLTSAGTSAPMLDGWYVRLYVEQLRRVACCRDCLIFVQKKCTFVRHFSHMRSDGRRGHVFLVQPRLMHVKYDVHAQDGAHARHARMLRAGKKRRWKPLKRCIWHSATSVHVQQRCNQRDHVQCTRCTSGPRCTRCLPLCKPLPGKMGQTPKPRNQ